MPRYRLHLGATSAAAQASKSQAVAAYWSNGIIMPTGSSAQANIVVSSNGDVYANNGANGTGWVKLGNVFTP